MVQVIVVSGNIGSGKSTAMHYLREHGFWTIEEPIDEWKHWLKIMYTGTDTDLYNFQMLVFSHYVRVTAILDEADDIQQPVFVERSPLDGLNIFLEVNRERVDFSALIAMYRIIAEHRVWKTATYVHLMLGPKECIKRIAVRDRAGEDQILLEYMEKLDALAKKWVTSETAHVHVLSTHHMSPQEIGQALASFKAPTSTASDAETDTDKLKRARLSPPICTSRKE
jgi:deoxyadenosine/deoxycytidine kinase